MLGGILVSPRPVTEWQLVTLSRTQTLVQVQSSINSWGDPDKFLMGDDFPIGTEGELTRRKLVGAVNYPRSLSEEGITGMQASLRHYDFYPVMVPIALAWFSSPWVRSDIFSRLKARNLPPDPTLLVIGETFRNRQNVQGYLAIQPQLRSGRARLSLITSEDLNRWQAPFLVIASLN